MREAARARGVHPACRGERVTSAQVERAGRCCRRPDSGTHTCWGRATVMVLVSPSSGPRVRRSDRCAERHNLLRKWPILKQKGQKNLAERDIAAPSFSRRRVFRRFSYHNRLYNIKNEQYFEYYALLWSHGLSPFFLAGVFFAVFLTIILSIILKMNHILNIMLSYGLMVYLPFARRRVF